MYIGTRGKGHKGIYVVKSEMAEEFRDKVDTSFIEIDQMRYELINIRKKISLLKLSLLNDNNLYSPDIDKIELELMRISNKLHGLSNTEFELYNLWANGFTKGL